MAVTTRKSTLSDAMLKRFAERAPGYDRENLFFNDDFAEMKQAGYLACAVPRELGGGGLTFAQVMQEQRRLAYHAHATALGINMNLYWTGVAADLWRAGDKSLEWRLTGAVKDCPLQFLASQITPSSASALISCEDIPSSSPYT